MKRITYPLLFTACLTLHAQQPWTVDQCMQYAVSHNHDVRLQHLAIDDYKAEKTSAVGTFLPSVEGSVGAQYSFGRAINPAHQNPDLPINFSIKMNLVKDLCDCLQRMGKRVKVSYF